MMFKSDKPDSVLFNTIPSYVCKSNEEGFFSFNNIIGGNYKIVSISGEDYSIMKMRLFHFLMK